MNDEGRRGAVTDAGKDAAFEKAIKAYQKAKALGADEVWARKLAEKQYLMHVQFMPERIEQASPSKSLFNRNQKEWLLAFVAAAAFMVAPTSLVCAWHAAERCPAVIATSLIIASIWAILLFYLPDPD